MTLPTSCRIHPTAILSPDVQLGENVEIGPFAVIDGPVTIGDDCLIRAGAYIYGPLTMGRANVVHSGAILGDTPQHLKFNNEPTSVEIGDRNIFREHVTVHRGTTSRMKTIVGSDNFFMVNTHVAHDCIIGNRCIFANGALLAGHCILEDNVILSGNSAVHQFVRLGRLSMLAGCSATQKDIPPFIIQLGLDNVGGINLVGLRRAGMSREQINAIRNAYKILYRDGLGLPAAIGKLNADMGHIDVIEEMVTFLRGCTKGINYVRNRFHDDLAA